MRMRMNGNHDVMDRGYLLASHIKGPFEIYGHEIKVGLVTMVVCFSLTLFSHLNEDIDGKLDLVRAVNLSKN